MAKKKCKITISEEAKAEFIRLGVYKKFISNAKSAFVNGVDFVEDFKGVKQMDAKSTLFCGFPWDKSPEKEDFWLDIYKKLSC